MNLILIIAEQPSVNFFTHTFNFKFQKVTFTSSTPAFMMQKLLLNDSVQECKNDAIYYELPLPDSSVREGKANEVHESVCRKIPVNRQDSMGRPYVLFVYRGVMKT